MSAEVFNLRAKISMDTKDYEKSVDESKKKFVDLGKVFKTVGSGITNSFSLIEKGAEKMASVTKTAFKVASAAVTAASGAMTKLVKDSLSEFANYEQLVGGVEKIFGKSAEKVRQYADEAYKTAGLSSNQYMEQVTSFSASLLQGLKGDTEKAADIANMAIQDMADNANTYGSDMASIQSAYQGFAKQNYSMLDNLKLGFGGTKSEMARLLNKANEIDSTILGKGVTVDEKFEDVSFDQMIRAIHTIQKELKITGTTADEAGRTISGSFGSMKAAWKNFLTGTGSPEQFVEALTGSIGNITRQLNKIIPRLVEGLKSLVVALAPELPKILMDILPTIIEGAASLLTSLTEQLPQLIDTLLPPLIQGATLVIIALVQHLPEILKSIGNALPKALTTVMENSGGLLSAGKEILGMIIDGMLKAASYLGNNIGKIIGKIADFLTDTDAIAKTVALAGKIINNLVTGLFSAENLNNLMNAAPKIIEALANGIFEGLVQFGKLGGNIISGLLNFLFGDNFADFSNGPWAALFTAASKIVDVIVAGIGAVGEAAWELLKGVGAQIARMLGVEDYYQKGVKMIEDLVKGARDAIAYVQRSAQRAGSDFYAWLWGVPSDEEIEMQNAKLEKSAKAKKALDKSMKAVFGQDYSKHGTYDEYGNFTFDDAYLNRNTSTNSADLVKAMLGINPESQVDVIKNSIDLYESRKYGDHGGSYAGAADAADYVKRTGVKGVPVFGNGGIVTKPTLALIGEDGAEAVVPLEKDSEVGRKFGGGVSIEKIEVNVDAHGIDDISNIGNIIVQQIDAALRRFQVQQTRGQGGVAW